MVWVQQDLLDNLDLMATLEILDQQVSQVLPDYLAGLVLTGYLEILDHLEHQGSQEDPVYREDQDSKALLAILVQVGHQVSAISALFHRLRVIQIFLTP